MHYFKGKCIGFKNSVFSLRPFLKTLSLSTVVLYLTCLAALVIVFLSTLVMCQSDILRQKEVITNYTNIKLNNIVSIEYVSLYFTVFVNLISLYM